MKTESSGWQNNRLEDYDDRLSWATPLHQHLPTNLVSSLSGLAESTQLHDNS